MDNKKKIGQLFIVGFPGKKITSKLKKLIHDYHVGGIILFSENIGSYIELAQLTKRLQKEAKLAGYKYPLLIGIDEENGTVKRISDTQNAYPGAMSLSATNNSDYAYGIGNATGKDLKKFGINWNYAPTLDINNNSDNPVISVRSFGEKPEIVSEFGIKFMKGLQDAGIASTLKHFPGHGDTNTDSHYELPIIEHDLEHLQKVELRPFLDAINHGADSIMVGHILFPALESEKDKPASLSKNIVTKLLRNKLNFGGVIITDALEMQAITERVGIDSAAVQALKAGVDSILIGHYPSEQIKALEKVEKAFNSGELSEKNISQSIKRMNVLKEKYTHWKNIENEKEINHFNRELNIEMIEKIYKKSVTVINEGKIISTNDSVLVLEIMDEINIIAEDTYNQELLFLHTVKKYLPNVEYLAVTNDLNEKQKRRILEKAKKTENIIIGMTSVNKNDKIIRFINELTNFRNINIISMKNPYIGSSFDHVNYWINTYEPNNTPIEIAVRTLIGDVKPTGISPIKIN